MFTYGYSKHWYISRNNRLGKHGLTRKIWLNISNDQDAFVARRRKAENLKETARRMRVKAVQHRIEALRLQLEEEETAGRADKLDIETHYLKRATIPRAEDEIETIEKQILAKQLEKYSEEPEFSRQQLVAQLDELNRTLEQKWDQLNLHKKQLKENEIEIERLRDKEFHAFTRAMNLERLDKILVEEAEEAETKVRIMLVEHQYELEEVPETFEN